MGYVEEAGGKLEAIILQENQVQVVHVDDLIAGRYRVTKVSPDSVEALDETLAQLPMAKPSGSKSNVLTASAGQQASTPPGAVAAARPQAMPVAQENDYASSVPSAGPVSARPAVIAQAQPTIPSSPATEERAATPQTEEPVANSLGYVQKADGKIEAVVADGDSIRLVPESPTVAWAQVTAPRPSPVETSPGQVFAPTAVTATSTGEEMTASAVDPDASSTLAMASLVRQASYEVSSPAPAAADGSAADGFGMGSAGGAVGASDGADDQTTPTFAENHSMATLVAAAHGQDKRATQSDGPTVRSAKISVEMKPLGFVVKGDGELAAILCQDDEVYIVRQGDRFADRYRAVSVAADAIEAVEEPPRHGQDGHATSSAAGVPPVSDHGQDGHATSSATGVPPVSDHGQDGYAASSAAGVPPVSDHGQDGHATFIFQTLAYVETQDGEMQAIVADGSQIYLVKQGENFAGQYRATSVDPSVVLATRVPPGQEVGNPLSAQTESGGELASKKLLGRANGRVLHEVDASGGPVLINLGMNLLDSSLTGFDLQSHFFTADNPNDSF
jgi:hypothetical protein